VCSECICGSANGGYVRMKRRVMCSRSLGQSVDLSTASVYASATVDCHCRCPNPGTGAENDVTIFVSSNSSPRKRL
jgi:hypothetical protein